MGSVKIHPHLGVAEFFTDNVFRTKKRRRSDYVTTIAPGIQALLPFGGGKHSLLLDYRAAQFLHHKESANNALAQHGVGHMEFNFPGGLKIDLQGGHIEGFDLRGSALDIQTQDITKWRINSFRSQAEFFGPRAGVRIRSSFADLHFKNNGQARPRDRKNLRSNLYLFARATSTVSGFIGGRVSNNDFDENKQLDSFAYGGFTGLRLDPTRLLSGEFRIGYTILNFDRAPVQQPQGSGLSTGGKQQKRLTMRGRLLWRPTSRQSINLRIFRTIRQSAVFDTTTFVQTGGAIRGRHSLTDRVGLQGRVFYSHNNFEEGRTDDRVRLRIGLEYKTLKWFGFRLDYGFQKRFSNENRFENYSNSVMLSVQALL